MRETKFAALSRLRTIDATLISSAATDQTAAPSNKTSALQAPIRFASGRARGGSGMPGFAERGAGV